MASFPYTIPSVDPHDIEDLVTDDGEPVDNIFSEKQQRLLTESLYASWQYPKFLAMANVGLFYDVKQPPLVPDVLVSLDVQLGENVLEKVNQSYFMWKHGKAPDLVIEIVSNKKGREAEKKLVDYAYIGVPYYAIFDPRQLISNHFLRLYELHHDEYIQKADRFLPKLGLSLKLWQGNYEALDAQWLRWYDKNNQLISAGKESTEQERQRADIEQQRANLEQQRANAEHERAELEKQRADIEQQRADSEKQRANIEQERAELEKQRADKLAAHLKALGIDPDVI